MSERQRDFIESLIVLALLLAYVTWMIAPAMDASFAMIDDHEVPYHLGPDRTMPLGEVSSRIADAAAEVTGRFRPGYWALRIPQIYLFGDRPALWHAAYIGKGLFTAAFLFLALRQLAQLRPWHCALVAAVFFAGPQTQVFARLGTAEAEAIPLMALALFVLARRVRSGDLRPASIAPGIVLLSLTPLIKETMLLLAPVAFAISTLGAGWTEQPRQAFRALGQWRKSDWLWTAGLAAFWLLNALAIRDAVQTYGHVYASRSTLDAYQYTFSQFTRMIARDSAYLIGVPLVLMAVAEARRRAKPVMIELAILSGMVLIAFVTLALPQVYFYAGTFVTPRYRMPANVTALVIVAFCLYRLRVSASDAGRPTPLSPGQYSARIIFELLIAAPILWHCFNRMIEVRWQSIAFAVETKDFSAFLDRVHEAAGPSTTGVVIQGGVGTYEGIFSTQRFLQFREPDRRIAVRVVDSSVTSPLAVRLEQHLRDVQEQGGAAMTPLDEVRRSGPDGYVEVLGHDATQPPEASRAFPMPR